MLGLSTVSTSLPKRLPVIYLCSSGSSSIYLFLMVSGFNFRSFSGLPMPVSFGCSASLTHCVKLPSGMNVRVHSVRSQQGCFHASHLGQQAVLRSTYFDIRQSAYFKACTSKQAPRLSYLDVSILKYISWLIFWNTHFKILKYVLWNMYFEICILKYAFWSTCLDVFWKTHFKVHTVLWSTYLEVHILKYISWCISKYIF